jgi:hypothetical protein
MNNIYFLNDHILNDHIPNDHIPNDHIPNLTPYSLYAASSFLHTFRIS